MKPINLINNVFNCDIMSKNRSQNNVFGRIGFSAFERFQSKLTLKKIGESLNKNHATVIHYLKEHDNLMKYDAKYREMYGKIIGVNKSKKWLCNECTYERIN